MYNKNILKEKMVMLMVLNTILKPGMTYVFTQWYFEVFNGNSSEMRVVSRG
jgi:hypothetical protein